MAFGPVIGIAGLCLRDGLDARHPYKHMRRALLAPKEWIRTELYGSDANLGFA